MEPETVAVLSSSYDAPKVQTDCTVARLEDEDVVDSIDPAVEKRVVRKCDFRVLPPVICLFMATFWDRVNSMSLS